MKILDLHDDEVSVHEIRNIMSMVTRDHGLIHEIKKLFILLIRISMQIPYQ